MLFYYYIYLLIALTGIFLLIKFLVARKKNIPVEFYFAALKNENNGFYEEAVINYEKALTEAKKKPVSPIAQGQDHRKNKGIAYRY